MRQLKKVSLINKMALPRIEGKALLTFIFCIIFSVSLWLLQVFRETNTASFKVSIEYQKIPNDLIILDSLPQSIHVQVKDKGLNLVSYWLSGHRDPLKLDCTPYFSESDVFQVSAIQLEQMLRSKFPTGEISVTHPQSIHSNYTKGASKRVPLRLRLSASFAKQKMQSGNIIATPNVITVYASESNLKHITEVATDSIIMDRLSDSTRFVASLPRLKGVRFVPDRVQIIIPVESYVEKHFTLTLESLNVPDRFTLKTFPQEVSLVCFLPMSRYKDVSSEQFQVGVYYQPEGSPSELPVSVIRKPEIASVVRVKPEKVEILLEREQ